MTTAMANGPCRVDQPSENPDLGMVRILAGDCSDQDRMTLAISAKEVFAALQAGKKVELDGVTLTGDLMLDGLPLEPLSPNTSLPEFVKGKFDREKLTEVRVLRGALIFRNVEVQGILATNLVNRGYLIAQGPVAITGSTIRRSMDFSRTVFLDEVDLSETNVGHEAFFIKAVFVKRANFSELAFGTHTRFHKAAFLELANFRRARLNGLAELLEVEFHHDADFSKTRFIQGTGFSGSQFRQVPKFSEARFEGETFFRFAQFERGANFRGAVFRKTADFTEATFSSESDFSRVVFEEPPQFTDERLRDQFLSLNTLQNSNNPAGLFVLAGLFLVFLYYLYRRKEAKSSK